MADSPQTLALITLAQQYAGDIVKQINRQTVALRVIPIVVGEGKNVAFVAEGDGQLAETYLDGADAANFGSDSQKSATLNWSLQRSNFRSTGLARAASRSSNTPEGNIQLWSRGLINSSAALASQINGQMFSGNGAASPKEITGLDSAIGNLTNTYATIDRTVDTYWKPTVTDPGTPEQITFAKIRDDLKKVYEASGQNPDVALCPPGVFNEVVNLFDSTRRYPQVESVNTARGKISLDAGYSGVEVEGCVFLKDKDATAGQIYYLNTNYIELQVLPQGDSVDLFPQPGTMLTANDGFGALPLAFDFEMLATNGDSRRAMIKSYLELKIDRPNAFGVRKNVATL